MPIPGSCLCGGVRFEIDGRVSPIGLCHCSKCRKAYGGPAAAELMTAAKSVRFTAGEQKIRRYAQPTGFSVQFCEDCGSPLPKPHRNGKLYWVPAGLLDEDPGVPVAMHIFVDSKASWDEIGGDAVQYPEDWPEQPEQA